MSFAILNNQIIPCEEVKISPFDRGFIYGDSIYEVILIYKNNLIFSEEHINRMINSVHEVYIKRITKDEIRATIDKLKVANKDIQFGYLYLQISRGVQFNRFSEQEMESTIFGYVEALDLESLYNKNDRNAIKLKTIIDERRFRRDIKMNSLLPMIIAKESLKEDNFQDCIFIDKETNFINESSAANVFIVNQDDKLITPPLSKRLLPGITRKFILHIAKKIGIDVLEREFDLEELYKAKEIFLSSSIKLITSVSFVDNIQISKSEIGKNTRKIKDYFITLLENYDTKN